METPMRLMIALIAAITSSSVAAAPAASTAQLAAPTRTATAVTEAGIWHCDGTTCTGMASPMLREAVAACTGVANTAGRVVAFTAAGYPFTDADLARCNRHVKS
jgi:hypothetical protein